MDIDFATVHGDRSIIEAAANSKKNNLKILAVTVLTSMDKKDLSDFSFKLQNNTIIIKSLKIETDLPQIIEKIRSKNINIKNIRINEPTLENVFLELTNNDK